MKNFLKFLEENSKWLVRALVGVGVFFIIKLWLVGMDVSDSCGGGYISLCLGWTFHYYWTIAGYLSIILLILLLFLVYKIKITKHNIKKIQIAFLIFIIGILGKQILFLISPEFKFYLTPYEKNYVDKDGNITDFDLYLNSILKYCKDNKYSKIVNCAGKQFNEFKTIDEYIKVLDFAKDNDYKILYELTYNTIEDNIGLQNMIERYNDETFQAYVIEREWDNVEITNWIIEVTNNKLIGRLILNINKKINEGEKVEKYDEQKIFWQDVNNYLKDEIKGIPEINTKILYY